MSSTLLPMLRDPGSGSALARDADDLVAADGTRFVVEDGIPVLLPAGDASGRREIVASFRARSSSYYADNYTQGSNPERIRRQHLVTELLASLAQPGTTVLDAGAGPAVLAEPARDLGLRYVALDLSLDNLVAGRGRVGELDAVVGELTAIPIASDAIGGALAIGALEYVPDRALAIGELCRVVEPGGFVIASFANSRSPRRWWDEVLVTPAIRLRARVMHTREMSYRRYLAGDRATSALFTRSGCDVRDVHWLNPGFAGYPLSAVRPVRRADEAMTARVPRLSSEFVVVARKHG